MKIEYDPEKDKKNREKHGLSFDQAAGFEFETAIVWEDERFDYGEKRYGSLGLVGERVHFLCFCETLEGLRVISFRKANKREVERYAKYIQKTTTSYRCRR